MVAALAAGLGLWSARAQFESFPAADLPEPPAPWAIHYCLDEPDRAVLREIRARLEALEPQLRTQAEYARRLGADGLPASPWIEPLSPLNYDFERGVDPAELRRYGRFMLERHLELSAVDQRVLTEARAGAATPEERAFVTREITREEAWRRLSLYSEEKLRLRELAADRFDQCRFTRQLSGRTR